MKSNKYIYWVLTVVIAAVAVFIYLIFGETPKTVPKIKLSYFVDEKEVADAVSKILFQEISQNQSFWIGMEPDKPEQVGVIVELKNELEKRHTYSKVFVDKELQLSSELLNQIKPTDVIEVKGQLSELGEQLQELEKSHTGYLLITASIYSNSILKKNPLISLKEKNNIRPMTFSLAYFPVSADDEKHMLFPCSTEDQSGTADWGCLIVNKSRFVRRKIEAANPKTWLGLMDLSGEKDYILILKKK